MSSDFRFDAPRNLAVYVCEHVGRGGQPILQVVRDEEGDWQFLCGRAHGDDERPMLVGLGHIVDEDPSVNELADLCANHTATRASREAPWEIVDDVEEIVRRNVREHGCHVMLVPEDEDGPGFAYSIGLHPELIVFGLPTNLMHWMVNELGKRMRNGEQGAHGGRIDGLLEGATCVLVEVDRTHYREYFGYTLWYRQGPSFRALQIVWPSKVTGKLPWADGGESLRPHQPVLTSSPP